MDFTSFREEMPVTGNVTYLNHASVGPIPTSTYKAWTKLADEMHQWGGVKTDMDPIVAGFPETRQAIAQLINGSPEEIALAMSTSQGISTILSGLDWSEDKRGLLINSLEYNSNSFAYQQISKRHDAPLLVIPHKTTLDGTQILPTELFGQYLEEHEVRVVGVSHVQFTNGFRSDLKALAHLCHKNDALLLVDGIQSVGAMQLDVKEMQVDFLCAGGYKWMLGPFASGFMFVREALLGQVEPYFVGSLADENPYDFQHHPFSPHQNALKFQGAHLPANLALAESVKLFLELGPKNIEQRVLSLSDHLVEVIKAEIPQAVIQSDRSEDHRSPIVRVTIPEVSLEGVVSKLKEEHNIIVSLRTGGIRISPHCYNTTEELDGLVKAIAGIIA